VQIVAFARRGVLAEAVPAGAPTSPGDHQRSGRPPRIALGDTAVSLASKPSRMACCPGGRTSNTWRVRTSRARSPKRSLAL
jgi:hypothetical protein